MVNLSDLVDRLGAWWNPEGTGVNLSRLAGLGLIVGVMGLVTAEAVVLVLSLGLLLFAIALRLWWSVALMALSRVRTVSRDRAFPDEEVTIELGVKNAKPLPLANIDLVETVTSNVEIDRINTEPSELARHSILRTSISAGMYQSVTHRVQLRTHRRGLHQFGPTTVSVKDPLGLLSRTATFSDTDEVVVFPRIVPIAVPVLPALEMIGDSTPPRRIVDDPMSVAGAREFEPGDDLRQIHWRATARTGTLQTKISQPTATPTGAIFLDTLSDPSEGFHPDRLELAVVLTASLGAELLQEQQQVGLYAMGSSQPDTLPLRLPPGRRHGHLTRFLEYLALLEPTYRAALEPLLVTTVPRLPMGATVIVITPHPTPALQRTMLRIARVTGSFRLVLISVGNPPRLEDDVGDQIRAFHLGSDRPWDEIDVISLAHAN